MIRDASKTYAPPPPSPPVFRYEVFNEVDYEHEHTPVSYTLEYDAIVTGIKRWLGPRADDITYYGLSLPNIDG
jgi:hypothetical protein